MSGKTVACGDSNFNWDIYEDGWNGCSRQGNKKVRKSKKNSSRDVIYSHEPYAQHLYDKMSKINVYNAKDAHKGDTLDITDVNVVDNDTLSVTVGGGANNILVDLNKENRLFEQFKVNNKPLTKEEFVDYVRTSPEFKSNLVSMQLTTKLGTDTQKGSMWDGWLEKFVKELKEQILLNNKAYYAEILSANPGGFVVNISNTIQGFMPGSMASGNKINDYESYVGRTLEVMVESYNPKHGFIVSRKKYINKMRPIKMGPIYEALDNEPDKIYTGRVTGATPFGVFVELDEFITGMLHKSLVSDELRDRMRRGEVQNGETIEVYVDRIEPSRDEKPDRVILSDVPVAERQAVEKKRKIEDDAEKKEYIAKRDALKKQENSENKPVENNAKQQ